MATNQGTEKDKLDRLRPIATAVARDIGVSLSASSTRQDAHTLLPGTRGFMTALRVKDHFAPYDAHRADRFVCRLSASVAHTKMIILDDHPRLFIPLHGPHLCSHADTMIHLDGLSGVLHFACQYLHIILSLTPFVSSDCSAHRTPRHNRPASSLVESISSSATSSSDRLSEAEEAPSVYTQSGQDDAQADVDLFERRIYDVAHHDYLKANTTHQGLELGSLSAIADLHNLRNRGLYLRIQTIDGLWLPGLPIKVVLAVLDDSGVIYARTWTPAIGVVKRFIMEAAAHAASTIISSHHRLRPHSQCSIQKAVGSGKPRHTQIPFYEIKPKARRLVETDSQSDGSTRVVRVYASGGGWVRRVTWEYA
ncbi:hypothetical protein PUNSTDRAFT_130509 [Punctularia strigosozonata HHB-11173 SS5]|uniref:uncharacterized protein n=1 Tax=Punctularia strigosozonata (strain HHB-11173) TaxID=741275 RepID=UPI00044176A3|nr:uncharacterized protein PUNSTDRAFT_130509 [Punctularia strigosozonata HHB-11173 SS5]EIN12243.1 hypothetical protein PUNSTDRAFT_130509 [Punctularia strigosozonata HHB-11173 SS5]